MEEDFRFMSKTDNTKCLCGCHEESNPILMDKLFGKCSCDCPKKQNSPKETDTRPMPINEKASNGDIQAEEWEIELRLAVDAYYAENDQYPLKQFIKTQIQLAVKKERELMIEDLEWVSCKKIKARHAIRLHIKECLSLQSNTKRGNTDEL